MRPILKRHWKGCWEQHVKCLSGSANNNISLSKLFGVDYSGNSDNNIIFLKKVMPAKIYGFVNKALPGFSNSSVSHPYNTNLRLFSTEKKNKYEWMDGTVFDDNIKFDKRKLLKKELKRGVGFVGDIRELRATGGKVFPASENLIDFMDAAKFPNIGNIQPLDELLPKRDFNSILRLTTNLVLISFNSFGRSQVQEWGNVFKHENPGIKLVEISASDNWGARMIEGWLRKSLRSTIDSSLHSTFFPIFQADEISKLCNGLDIENRLVSYAYLVDTHGFVRWRGTGAPNAQELDSLLRCGFELANDAKK